MKSHFSKWSVESLERRSLMSASVAADFNNDGLMDVATLTDSTTITVSLANPDGSYRVSAVLNAPGGYPIQAFSVGDYNGDGRLDISGGGLGNNRFYSHTWLGNGDGTFGNRTTQKSGRIGPGW